MPADTIQKVADNGNITAQDVRRFLLNPANKDEIPGIVGVLAKAERTRLHPLTIDSDEARKFSDRWRRLAESYGN